MIAIRTKNINVASISAERRKREPALEQLLLNWRYAVEQL